MQYYCSAVVRSIEVPGCRLHTCTVSLPDYDDDEDDYDDDDDDTNDSDVTWRPQLRPYWQSGRMLKQRCLANSTHVSPAPRGGIEP